MMKSVWGIGLFVLFGLLTAFGIGFWPLLSKSSNVYDEEQLGLGQERVIKFSFVVAENTPKGLAAQRFAELVKEYTKGRVKVELFPDGILYNEPDEVDALRRGNVQMIAPSFANISEIAPAWTVMDLPFAFANEDAVQEAFDGAIGKRLFQELGKRDIVGMAFWKNGFKEMTSNKGPIVRPSDFQGLRFRILPSQVIDMQFRELGAKTVAIPFNQVYRNLESGGVNGEENAISNIYTKKFYQVQKYITLSNHGYLGYGVLMNKPYWERLPSTLQKAIQKAMDETTRWANDNAVALNNKELRELKALPGVQVQELTQEQREEWKVALDPVYEQSEPVIGKELIGEVRQLQRKYEGQAAQ
jgi:C4-dicarboxylate-binding protein DctP